MKHVIPFDYKKWKSGKYSRILMRNGEEITDLKDSYYNGLFPLYSIHLKQSFTIHGKYTISNNDDHDMDLFLEIDDTYISLFEKLGVPPNITLKTQDVLCWGYFMVMCFLIIIFNSSQIKPILITYLIIGYIVLLLLIILFSLKIWVNNKK